MNTNNPFTTTPGIAGEAYIDNNYANEIIQSFESKYSTQYVYKILGQRGSGKSVEYAKVMNHFSLKDKEWKVYGLSSGGDPIQVWLSALSREPEIDSLVASTEISENVEGGGSLFGMVEAKGTLSHTVSKTPNPHFFSDEDSLEYMCETLCIKGYKILIGIDDIVKTPNTIRFLSIVGKLLLNGKINLHFVCTGLYKNIEDFTNEAHLSFFVRPASLVVDGLGEISISLMYQKLLGLDAKKALEYAKITMGYAWGYQLLGYILFNKGKDTPMPEILEEFDSEMAQTYDLIWNSMTDAEQKLVKIIAETSSEKREDIEAKMEKTGYDSLRQRLSSKHIIKAYKIGTTGYVKILLPRYKEYIEAWH